MSTYIYNIYVIYTSGNPPHPPKIHLYTFSDMITSLIQIHLVKKPPNNYLLLSTTIKGIYIHILHNNVLREVIPDCVVTKYVWSVVVSVARECLWFPSGVE